MRKEKQLDWTNRPAKTLWRVGMLVCDASKKMGWEPNEVWEKVAHMLHDSSFADYDDVANGRGISIAWDKDTVSIYMYDKEVAR